MDDAGAILVQLAALYWSSFVMTSQSKIYQRTCGHVLMDFCCFLRTQLLAEPYGFFWIWLPSLIHEWCLQVDWATDANSCELNCWYFDNTDLFYLQELYLNRSTYFFALLTFWFHYQLWMGLNGDKAFKYTYEVKFEKYREMLGSREGSLMGRRKNKKNVKEKNIYLHIIFYLSD